MQKGHRSRKKYFMRFDVSIIKELDTWQLLTFFRGYPVTFLKVLNWASDDSNCSTKCFAWNQKKNMSTNEILLGGHFLLCILEFWDSLCNSTYLKILIKVTKMSLVFHQIKDYFLSGLFWVEMCSNNLLSVKSNFLCSSTSLFSAACQ